MPRASLSVVVLLGFGTLACGSGEVSARVTSAKTEVDLGRQPPLLRATLRSELAPLAESRRFERAFTTCGCLGATLFADGRPVAAGSTVGGGQKLTLVAELEGRGHAGRAVEHVRVFFSAGDRGSPAAKRELEIRCVFDRAKSVVSGRSLLAFVPLPGGEATEELALDAPLVGSDVRVEGPAWLRAEFIEDARGAGPGTVLLRAGPVDLAGLYEATVLLPVANGFFERVSVSLRVASRELLRPARIVARLPVGATQELFLVLSGRDLRVGPMEIEWEADTSIEVESRPQLEMRALSSPIQGTSGLRLVLRIAAGSSPGVFKGRALIRPRRNCSYRLALPWLVRVTAGVASALPAGNEERAR